MIDNDNREFVNGKVVVNFTGDVEFHKLFNTETGKQVEVATVFGVLDHPRLGFQHVVYTSEVVLKCEDEKSFETVNTFYRRAV